MKLTVILAMLFWAAQAQVTFVNFPEDKQLFARDLITDSASVLISGTVNSNGVAYTSIKINRYRGETLNGTQEQELVFNGNTASFEFNTNIKAELENYRFEAIGVSSSTESIISTASEVVAGDVYIILGQSNAEASRKRDNEDANTYKSPFIRVYGHGNSRGAPQDWCEGQGNGAMYSKANTGQWGMVMARHIVDNQKIPVAVFNGADGGKKIDFFQRNDNDPADTSTNYGRLLERVLLTNLNNGIRAFIWHQGEANTNGMEVEEYKELWQSLHSDWMEDFPSLEKAYIFQLRNGCNGSREGVIKIKEAHRQLALEGENVEIMSTSGVDHHEDNCHYSFVGGYEIFGNQIYGKIAKDLYRAPENNVEAPQVLRAEWVSGNEITLVMKNENDTYSWIEGAENDFQIKGDNLKVTAGEVDGNRVHLTLSGNAAKVTAITYLGHAQQREPMVENANGIGTVHFLNLPVTEPVNALHSRHNPGNMIILGNNGNRVSLKILPPYKRGTAQILNSRGNVLLVIQPDARGVFSWNMSDLSSGQFIFRTLDPGRSFAPVYLFTNPLQGY